MAKSKYKKKKHTQKEYTDSFQNEKNEEALEIGEKNNLQNIIKI